MSESTQADVKGYVQVLRRRIFWVLGATILCVVIAVAFSTAQKKQYAATAQLLVQPASGSIPLSGTQQTVSPTDVLTELQLVTSAPVAEAATKQLGYSAHISASELGQTNVIALTVTAPSPAEAARGANVYAQTFVSYQRKNAIDALTSAEQELQSEINGIDTELQSLGSQKNQTSQTGATISALSSQEVVLKEELAQLQVTGAETPGGVEVVSPAVAPSSPSSPKPLRTGLIALIIGLILGVGAAFAVDYFDDKVYTKDQAERLAGGIPILAIVPKIRGWGKGLRTVLIADADPFSSATEAYRLLRTSLQFAAHDRPLRTILITSASGSEGKTSTTANLGVVLAKAGERVVVVNCDLRRPRLATFFGRGETPGFTSVLVGHGDVKAELKRALQPAPNIPGLALLAAGLMPPNAAELLGSEKSAEIFKVLAGAFETVLIDSPPLLPVADAQVLASYADAILLVVTAGMTTEGELQRAVELLTQVNARPIGIVLNKASGRSGSGGEYGYGYKYRYTPQQGTTALSRNGNGIRPAGHRGTVDRPAIS